MKTEQANRIAESFIVEAESIGRRMCRLLSRYRVMATDEFREAVSPSLANRIEDTKAAIDRDLDAAGRGEP